MAFDEESFARAKVLVDESLASFREAGALKMLARALSTRVSIALAQGAPEGPTILLEESGGHKRRSAIARGPPGCCSCSDGALQRGAVVQARTLRLNGLR